jgi:hypothetical protein
MWFFDQPRRIVEETMEKVAVQQAESQRVNLHGRLLLAGKK